MKHLLNVWMAALLLTGVAGAVAQSYSRSVVTQGTYGAAEDRAVKHGLHKSLMGIEVHFRFDKSQLDLSYMGNAEALDRFARVLDSIGITHIDSVVIVSQSSPEGVYQHNVKLSQRRAATMRRAIEGLSVKADFALIDGNITRGFTLPCRSVIHGDAISPSIAAASILAKVTRDRICLELDAAHPEYGIAKHKGYGTKAHMDALREFGPSPIHRKKFIRFLENDT